MLYFRTINALSLDQNQFLDARKKRQTQMMSFIVPSTNSLDAIAIYNSSSAQGQTSEFLGSGCWLFLFIRIIQCLIRITFLSQMYKRNQRRLDCKSCSHYELCLFYCLDCVQFILITCIYVFSNMSEWLYHRCYSGQWLFSLPNRNISRCHFQRIMSILSFWVHHS